MSYTSQPNLKRMPAETLSALLLSDKASEIAVIDVRGDDHVGGHIKDSHHVPSTSLDYRTPELARTMADKEIVVFHCALSQERGPRAARGYLEEKRKQSTKASAGSDALKKGQERLEPEDTAPNSISKEQEVYVLDKGFMGWQEKFGTDERLTEAYAPDIWTDY